MMRHYVCCMSALDQKRRRCGRSIHFDIGVPARAMPKVTAVAATTMQITSAAVIRRCASAILRFVNGRALRLGWWNPIPATRSLGMMLSSNAANQR